MTSATQAALRPSTDHRSSSATTAGRPTPSPPQVTAAELSRLEAFATEVSERAVEAGLDILHVGNEPLFAVPRLYADDRPWVICPAARDPLVTAGLPIPARQRRALGDIVQAGLDFPRLYLAHEVPAGMALPAKAGSGAVVDLRDDEVHRLVSRPVAPARTVATADTLERGARTAGRAVARGAVAAATVPILAIAAAFDGLDPAVFGVVTAPGVPAVPGTHGAWFLLASWDW